jgi:hypothetical protein
LYKISRKFYQHPQLIYGIFLFLQKGGSGGADGVYKIPKEFYSGG